jgi:PST family polysaccharide transporter
VAMLYFSVIVIYGFNTTATRKIAESPNNLKKVSYIFSAVFYTRVFLFLVSAVAFLLSMVFIPKFAENSQLLWYAFPVVLGWALFPDFLFQGLQQLKVTAISNFTIKLSAAILIFVFLKSKEDFVLVLLINSVAQIAAGVYTLVYAFKMVNGLTFLKLEWRAIKSFLKNGLYVFLSHFFTRVYTFGSIIFLGLMLTDIEVGLYAAGMKLITVSQSFLFLPLFGALFPYLTNLFKADRNKYSVEFKRAFLIMLLVTTVSAAILFVFPEFFIRLVFGTDYLSVAPLLRIMAPILVISTVIQFSLQQGLIVLKKDSTYLVLIVSAGVLSILLNLLVIPVFKTEGAAIVKLVVDVLLAVFGWVFYKKAMAKLPAT